MKRAENRSVRGSSQPSILATAIALALPLLMTPVAPALAQETGAGPAATQAQQTYQFDIPAKPLPQAIADLSAVTGLQVLYTEQSTFDHTAPALRGSYTIDDALQHLLAGSGLAMRFTGENSVTIELASEEAVKTLPSVMVLASSSGPTTEGVDSYTATGPGRSATGLSLS